MNPTPHPSPPDATTRLVPYVAVRCPHCGENKPVTYAVRNRIRYHRCQHCDRKFRSLEVPAGAVLGWSEPAISATLAAAPVRQASTFSSEKLRSRA